MPNVSFSAIVSASGSPGNFRAAPFSQNFDNVVSIVNTQHYGFDSANYATDSGGFGSRHIATNQIQSSHLTDGAVGLGKIQSYQLGSAYIDFKSSAAGVMALQHAASASAYIPRLCPCSLTWKPAANTEMTSVVFSYSTHGIYGDPAFTATPVAVGAPVVRHSSAAAGYGAVQHAIYAMGSVSCGVKINFSASVSSNATLTINMAFMGW